MEPSGSYKGHSFVSSPTQTESGKHRARVAIMALDGTRTRSQRFLDLETFPTESEAHGRAVTAARAWIDANSENDRLALPTNFAAFSDRPAVTFQDVF